jgi:hypothetical protein
MVVEESTEASSVIVILREERSYESIFYTGGQKKNKDNKFDVRNSNDTNRLSRRLFVPQLFEASTGSCLLVLDLNHTVFNGSAVHGA